MTGQKPKVQLYLSLYNNYNLLLLSSGGRSRLAPGTHGITNNKAITTLLPLPSQKKPHTITTSITAVTYTCYRTVSFRLNNIIGTPVPSSI